MFYYFEVVILTTTAVSLEITFVTSESPACNELFRIPVSCVQTNDGLSPYMISKPILTLTPPRLHSVQAPKE
jgi:hypothetical protein